MDGLAFCEVLAGALFVASGRPDGKLVNLTGFLASDQGVLTLFPSEHDYRLRISLHSRVVQGTHEQQQSLMPAHGNHYVKLFGKHGSTDQALLRYGKVGVIRPEHADEVRVRERDLGAEELRIVYDSATALPQN